MSLSSECPARDISFPVRFKPWLKGISIFLSLMLFVSHASALPSKVIILRHGEKSLHTWPNGIYGLCSAGWSRSVALSEKYLGKKATESLLPKSGAAAFFAITPHTFELASPSTVSWGIPLITYSAVQLPEESNDSFTKELNVRTQQAAWDVMHNPRWNNKVVVMIWEHKHIADAKLESSTKEHVTLRQLLNLDKMESAVSIPESWSDDNYDFFWIATYGKRSSKIPTKFEAIQQDYPDTSIPSNAWNVWTTLPPDCDNQPDPATP